MRRLTTTSYETICMVFSFLVLLLSSSLFAADGLIRSPEADWPQWRGPYRDGYSAETGLLSVWPVEGPRLLWELDGLGKGWSSAIVVGQRIYITGDVEDDLVIFAFDERGKLVWQEKNGKAWKGSYPGARASCVYSEGRLYHMNAHGRLVCLDAASGKEQWAVPVLERFEAKNIRWALSECLLVDGSRVFATPGGKKALMVALDKQNGRTLWATDPLGKDAATNSSPILFQYDGRRLIANCSSKHGFGVDADTGKLLWTVPLTNPHGVNAATPIYGKGGVFYATPYAERGRLYRLSTSGPAVSAKHLWTSDLDTVTGSAVLVDNTLYGAGYKAFKWWIGLDWSNGETTCQLRDLTTGAAIHAEGHLYCLDEKGAVALVKPSPQRLQVVSRFSLPLEKKKKDAWAHPVLCNGRLYLRYHERLWCYDVSE